MNDYFSDMFSRRTVKTFNSANLQRNICFRSATWCNFFFQSKSIDTLKVFFSCFSSWSLILYRISTQFVFVLAVFTFIGIRLLVLSFSPCCKYVTLLIYIWLSHVRRSGFILHAENDFVYKPEVVIEFWGLEV